LLEYITIVYGFSYSFDVTMINMLFLKYKILLVLINVSFYSLLFTNSNINNEKLYNNCNV